MNYPRYPKYIDSGVEWLGEIPEGWEVKKLKFLSQFSGGGTPSTENDSYWNGDIPWVSSKDMKTELIRDTELHITDDGIQNSPAKIIPAGSLLMVIRSGILQHTLPVAENVVDVTVNQDIRVIIPNDHINKSYLRHFFRGHNNQLLAILQKQGATVESIEQDLLANCPVICPKKTTQKSITSFLDTETLKIDGLIKNYEELIELLQEKRQALISHAVTRGLSELVSSDDPEFGEWAKPVTFKDSGVEWLGEIPEEWNVNESRWLFQERKERANLNDRQATASQKYGIIFQDEFMEIENQKVMQVLKDFSILKKVCPNDFVISMRSFQGGLELSTLEGSMSSAYVAIIPDLKKVFPRYYKWVFKSLKYIQALQNTTNLIRDGQALRYRNFIQIPLHTPSLLEQKAIALFLDREMQYSEELCSETQSAIELLKEHRSALITNAVTGKINVEGITHTPSRLPGRQNP